MDGHERARLVKNYLESSGTSSGKAKAHAYRLSAVENLLAEGFGPAVRAVSRLEEQGMSRREALEAVAEVLCRNPTDTYSGGEELSTQERQLRLNAALELVSSTRPQT